MEQIFEKSKRRFQFKNFRKHNADKNMLISQMQIIVGSSSLNFKDKDRGLTKRYPIKSEKLINNIGGSSSSRFSGSTKQ